MVISERNGALRRISKPMLNYIKKREIGSGTFGKVFEAVKNGTKYAIKKFTYAKEAYHLTTLREIKALRAIKSRYVLQIKEIVVENFQIYLVFDFYDYDLYRLIGIENFTLCDIRHIFWQVLKGVEAIHRHGYLHRDLKTANILIGRALHPEEPVGMSRSSSRRDMYNGEMDRYDARWDGYYNSRGYYDDRDVRHDDRSRLHTGRGDRCYDSRGQRADEYSDRNHHCDDRASSSGMENGMKSPAGKYRCVLGSPAPTGDEDYPGKPSEYEVRICDFGMARQKSKEMTPDVVTLWYRAPELLLGLATYSKAVDVWSLGCILLEFFKKKPIFKANTEVENLEMIADLCGSIDEQSVPDCARYPLYPKYNLKEGTRCIVERFSPCSAKAADLADKMLILDPEQRITIEECLQHSFFKNS